MVQERVYVCGPMTGLPDFNYPAFHAAAADLRARGYEVVNPAELNTHATPRDVAMRRNLLALLGCQRLFTLPGWEDSPGALLEVQVSLETGIAVEAYELPQGR